MNTPTSENSNQAKGIRERHYTFQEVADELGVKLGWIYKQSSLGRLVAYQLGSRKVVNEADLKKFLGDQRARAQHKKDQSPPTRPETTAAVPYEPLPIDSEVYELVFGGSK